MTTSSNKIVQALVCTIFLFSFCRQSHAEDESTYTKALQTKAQLLKISDSSAWSKLLYYTDSVFRGYRGVFDSKKFYFAKNGKYDASAELTATLAAFFVPASNFSDQNLHPICAFPARFEFLNKRLNFDSSKVPSVDCKRLNDWLGANDIQRISIVFSSYFPDNPASMFGHTFVRLHYKKESTRADQMLDSSINYSAQPTEFNALTYPIKGVFGSYPGRYQLLPYFVKLQEYNNSDSRDLWEYELDFTTEEIRFLQKAIWEIGDNHADYYYFDDNCSAILLTLLDAVKPSLSLRSQLSPWVIPSQTLRVITNTPGLVRKVRYEPSILTTFLLRYKDLNDSEKSYVDGILNSSLDSIEKYLTTIPNRSKSKTIDTTLDYIDFKDRVAGSSTGGEHKKIRNKLLVARSKIRDKPRTYEHYPEHERPDIGHNNAYIGLAAGPMVGEDIGYQFLWRPALHELVANNTGYPNGLEIGFFHSDLRYTPKTKELYVNDWGLLRIWSLPTSPRIIRKPAWTLDLASTSVWECGNGQSRCQRAYASAAGGINLHFIKNKIIPFVLAGADAGISEHKDQKAYIGPTAYTGVYLNISENFKAMIKNKITKRYSTDQAIFERDIKMDINHTISDQTELRLTARDAKNYRELILGVHLYY